MAKYKPLRVGPNYPFEQIQPGSDEIDGKIWVSQNAVVLGRTSAGAGPHQEIPISSLGGGGSYEPITVAELQAKITAGTLTPGGAYLVTDASGTDGGFFTVAPTNNSIDPSGVGIFLNADFQSVGDYSGVEGVTGIAAGTQRGIWRLSFEAVTLPYTLLTPDYINYSGASGPLTDGEAYTTDGGHTGTIIHDDEAGTITLIPDQPLSSGEILTGSSSGNFVTVDSYTDLGFSAGDTITGNISGATATVVSDDGSNLVVNVTSAGVSFDPSEMFDNGNGTVGGTTGAASSPDIQQGDVVIWNLLHWQLVDLAQINGQNPADNPAAYTLLEKTVENVGYVVAYDVAEWDQVNNAIEYRQDSRGGLVRGNAGVSGYQFGRDDCAGNNIQSPATLDIRNLIASFNNNTTYPGATIQGIVTGEGTTIEDNILENGASVSNTTLGSNVQVSRNKIGQGCSIQLQLADNSQATDNILSSSSVISGISSTGHCFVTNNVLSNNAFLGNINLDQSTSVQGNVITNGSIENITLLNNTVLEQNTVEQNGAIRDITAGSNCSISRNKIGQGATLGGGTVMGDGAQLNDSYMESGSVLGGLSIGAGSSVNFSRIYSNGEIAGHKIGEGAALNNTSVGVSAAYSNKTISDGIFVTGLVVNIGTNSVETIASDLDAKKTEIGFSNFSAIIDITAATTLDYLFSNRHAGIIYLTSSNPAETLDTIVNFPTLFPLQLRPQGFTLTITGTPISGIGAGQIALKAASYVLDGTNGEYIELEADPTNTYLVEKRVTNGII